MSSKQVLTTLAITAAVATFAVLNTNTAPKSTFLTATPITDAEREFINFISKYQRNYQTKEEYNYRLSIFEEAYAQILEHSQKDGLTYSLGITSLTDLSTEEYKQLLGRRPNTEVKNYMVLEDVTAANGGVDWRNEGAVTPIKNQGQCGSCWAFSSTGALEGMHKIASGKLVSLSEQQLVDCSTAYGNQGCNGGWEDQAFKYVHDHGITTESSYEYTGRDGKCKSFTVAVTSSGHYDVPADDPSQLTAAINKQPVSVGIEADKSVFQYYTGGIINSASCGTSIDHAVLAIGYGTDKSDYWLVKNSWGTGWGESGYFRLANDGKKGKGICGILQEASYPKA